MKLDFPRIRDLREDCEKSQREIAELLHLQLTVYRRYELGEREAPAWVLAQLADYYNVSTDYLFGRTNDPRPPKRR